MKPWDTTWKINTHTQLTPMTLWIPKNKIKPNQRNITIKRKDWLPFLPWRTSWVWKKWKKNKDRIKNPKPKMKTKLSIKVISYLYRQSFSILTLLSLFNLKPSNYSPCFRCVFLFYKESLEFRCPKGGLLKIKNRITFKI